MKRLSTIAAWFLGFAIAVTSIAADRKSPERRGTGISRLLGPFDEAHQKKMDADGDGKVSVDEFTRYATDASGGRLNANIGSMIFRKYDADGDGDLTLAELQKLQAISGTPSADPPTPPPTAVAVATPTPIAPKPEAPVAARPWKQGSQATLPSTKLDDLLDAALATEERAAAAPLTDDQFLRRLTLDLTGKPPMAADVEAFLADTASDKSAAAIQRLLATDDFARHTAHFWRDVMQSKASTTQVVYELHRGAALEDWLCAQLQVNRSWAKITHDLLTASGGIAMPTEAKDGAVGFLLCHSGDDAAVGRAVDTTRVFLGIQLECAQCHNHPTDVWKREQFHKFAAYFGRIKDGKAGAGRGIVLTSAVRGEYEMPDKYDASKTSVVHPKFFLNGEALGVGRDDQTRRQALADEVTASPWFAKAFVNRMWAQLMGRGFVEPVDNLGPSQKAVYPELLDALAESFVASGYNVKELVATIVGSRAYRRELRLGESRQEHLHFVGSSPLRLRGEELWDALTVAVGPFAEKTALPVGLREVLGRVRNPDFFTVFKRLFDYDPSATPGEAEPSVAQTLMLLNNPAINAQIRAVGDTPLARIAAEHPQNDDAIRQVYLQVLSRRPSDDELRTCREYLGEIGDRAEGLEDLMWALVNSAEFRIKH